MFDKNKLNIAFLGGKINEHKVIRRRAERKLSKGYISQIESEHASPSMETFLNIIEVLGTTPSEF